MGDQHPGPSIEEVPASPRTIEGVPTGTAGFVGMAGSPWEAHLISSWFDFRRLWPQPSALAEAVELFFLNGGSTAWAFSVDELGASAVRAALSAMDHDVAVVAVVADPPARPEIIRAAAETVAARRAMLVVEGPWAEADSAIAELSDLGPVAVGAGGADIAVYWPRLRRDRGQGVTEAVSPLGAVLGVIARTDRERGVFAAPAGASAAVRGVIEPAGLATPAQQAALNELGVNLIRSFPQLRTVVWGARNLSRDHEWRSVPVRRLFLFLEESIERGLQWVVFEPNGESLWRRVRVAIEDFLRRLWKQGAFQGQTSDDAFFVRCDETTMTHQDLDAGRLVCTVGIAAARPAEFVIFHIGAWTADADRSE